MAVDALPLDVSATLMGFLLGQELLRLSHTSRALRNLVDKSSSIWSARLFDSPQCDISAKQALLRATSLRFRGTQTTDTTTTVSSSDRYSSANLHGIVLEWGEVIAFDVWFSLLPPGEDDTRTVVGGVLLGAQSVAYEDPRWPFYHRQFLVVDSDCHLYCSVVNMTPKRIATLETRRWYHLALVYDGRNDERVYLNGELLAHTHGSLHHESYSLRCMQLGTGCMSAGSTGKPTPSFRGWYGFHGLVDEFRTWSAALSHDAVRQLAMGTRIQDHRPRFSLRHSSGVVPKGGAQHVRCSRPLERMCALYGHDKSGVLPHQQSPTSSSFRQHCHTIPVPAKAKMENPPHGYIFYVDALPSDTFECLAAFLTGFDLFALSHVNRRLLTELLASGSYLWKQRVPLGDPTNGISTSAKQRYVSSRSLKFPGRNKRQSQDTPTLGREGAVELPFPLTRFWSSESFSFDLWFCMSNDATSLRGGIILGAQSGCWSDTTSWPHYHQQLVHVDPRGTLYCSVGDVDRKQVVARNLKPRRWYHLALTFHEATQCVYLDGALVQTSDGRRNREWRTLSHFQLGTGCISGNAKGQPAPALCGWYGFHGVLDAFRSWDGVLSHDQIQQLRGGDEMAVRTQVGCAYSLQEQRHTSRATFGRVAIVRCSRPEESKYYMY